MLAERWKFFQEHPRTRDSKDYWGQVQRTVFGKPVGEDQIRLIVDSILSGLALQPEDLLLDLCCGNGALTDRIFERCKGGLGVDYSEPLIEVARRDFEVPGQRDYRLDDAVAFVASASGGQGFTKALCYGSFMYLAAEPAERLLTSVRTGFPEIRQLMIGNLPDKSRVGDFFGADHYRPGIEDDADAALGLWRTEDEMTDLARRCGWACAISRQPPSFYASRYRYDAVLTPTAK